MPGDGKPPLIPAENNLLHKSGAVNEEKRRFFNGRLEKTVIFCETIYWQGNRFGEFMGLFSKTVQFIKEHLSRTRQKIGSSLSAILTIGRKIDAELLNELEQTLISDDIGVETTERLIEDLRQAWKAGKISASEDVVPFLKEQMKNCWPAQNRQLCMAEAGPTVILVAGINGSGKTTSIAKLAYILSRNGKKVIVAACDTFRAAAVEQLSIWAQRIGVEIIRHQQGSDPAAVAYDACQAAVSRNVDYLILDTAGRLHTQKHLMDELGKIRNVVVRQIPGAPHEVLLVLDATTGQNAIMQARMFTETVKVSGIFLAKLDGTARGGIVIAIKDMLDIPVKFVGLGEQPEDIAEFDPDEFVEALFA
jgi:fused signal recognition particle receptor